MPLALGCARAVRPPLRHPRPRALRRGLRAAAARYGASPPAPVPAVPWRARGDLLERSPQLTPPLSGTDHSKNDSGHRATAGRKRRCKALPLAEFLASDSESLAQRSLRERFARRECALERNARLDERRDAPECDRQVAATRARAADVPILLMREGDGKQAAIKDQCARVLGA